MRCQSDAECAEEKRLFAKLSHTLGSLVEIQSSQMAALAMGDRQISRFEEEIRVAICAWQHARHALHAAPIGSRLPFQQGSDLK